MNLNVKDWKYFCLDKLFKIEAGIYHYKDEYDEGNTPYCSCTTENNGIIGKINLSPDFTGNKIIISKISATTFYEAEPFCATSDVNVLTPNFDMSSYCALFIATVINKNENYRWCYGRQCRTGNTKRIKIKLPIKKDIIDENKEFSDEGYTPDWQFMENYIKSLHYKSISTEVTKESSIKLDTSNWKPFFLYRLFNASMGNGIDACTVTSDAPKYNYVSRNSNWNGVVGFVDEIEGENCFNPGNMTLALGGSYLGSCFIQPKAFYTAQNVGVLKDKTPLSVYTKLFISTLIRNECKIKYQAFGRELNSHFRKDFSIKLPIKYEDSQPFIDSNKTFSDDGFVPDWQFMENYIKSLPYSDRI